MNDLSALLDATQVTTCEFLGQTIKLDVYTAGISRLTHEESVAFREVVVRYDEPRSRAIELQKQIEITEEPQKLELQKELNDLDTGSVETMRVVVPMMLAGWSLNGEPMKRNGEPYPPTKENLETVPDNLLLAVGEAAQAVWQNPIPPVSESGLGQTENLDNSQTETTTPLAISD